MTDVRETIAAVLSGAYESPQSHHDMTADAILAALPEIIAGMVEPLEWEETTSGTSRFPAWKSGQYFIVNSLNTGFFIMGKQKYNGLSDAIDAANAHNVATILKELGMKGEDDVE